MFRVFAEYQGNSLVTELPRDVYNLRAEFGSIGYTQSLTKFPLLMDEDADLQLYIYPYSELEQAVFGKIAEGDTLLQLNVVARYLENRSYLLDAEEVQKYDVSGLRAVYQKLSEPKQPDTTNMVIHTKLVRKEYDFTPTACIVEAAIPVSAEEFYKLRNNPLQDHPLIEEHFDDMFTEDNEVRHCILIYDREQGDGLLIDAEGASYARYAQYIPGAKTLVEQHEQQMQQAEELSEEQDDSPGLTGNGM